MSEIDLIDDSIHIIDPQTGNTFCNKLIANLLSPLQAINAWEVTTNQIDIWTGCWTCLKESDRYFKNAIDRDLKNCIIYADIMGYDDPYDVGDIMFELNPAEVIGWHWAKEFNELARLDRRIESLLD